MRLMVIFLKQEELLDNILTLMAETGLTGASVIDGVNMERILADDVPIFAGLLNSFSGARTYNKNIFVIVPHEAQVDELLKLFKEEKIDFQAPDTGFLFTVPIDKFLGHFEAGL